jgi:hypothetical protein
MNEPEFDKSLRLILNVGCQFGFGSIVCRKYILSLFGDFLKNFKIFNHE